MKYYLDTNIIIYALKNSFPNLKEHFYNIPAQSIVIPTIVVAEIEYGAYKSADYDRTMNLYKPFLDAFEKIGFSEKAAVEYGKIRTQIEEDGTIIGNNSLIIASIVKAEEGVLVTHNVNEFERVRGLKTEDWTV